MSLKVDYLVNHQEHIPLLASWFKTQNPEFFAHSTLTDIARAHFETRLNRDALPISFIAMMDGSPVGTIALLPESVTTHTHLTPWLAGLHVHTDFRHQGIGMALVAHGLEKASELGFACVYAGIGGAEESYGRQGWRTVERVSYCEKPLSIMKYQF